MIFSHDFGLDLQAILRAADANESFALARLADGERALLNGESVVTADGWTVPAEPTGFVSALRDSLEYDADGYYLGLGCPCCDRSTHDFLMAHRRIPDEHSTFSNVFVNGNHETFSNWAVTREFTLVSSAERSPIEFRVPKNVVNVDWDMDGLIERLTQVKRGCILVAAGPASSIIIHRYWRHHRDRRAIIDVGSALDPMIHARTTRPYQTQEHPDRFKICTWR